MAPPRAAPRPVRAHTITGPIKAPSLEQLEDEISYSVAYDAARRGLLRERPYLVDEQGRTIRPLKRYEEYLSSASLYDHPEASPPQRAQAALLRPFLAACEGARAEVGAVPRERELVDPGAAAILRAEAKRFAAMMLRLIEGAEHLAKDVEDL